MMADRPYLRVFDLNNCFNGGFNATNAGTAIVIADQTNSDGMIIDELELISRGGVYAVNLYLSSSNTVFRGLAGNQTGGAQFFARQTSGSKDYETTAFVLPRLLTPVPRVGTEPYSRGLYLPRGYAIWAAIDTTVANTTNGPNILIQGGLY
jgi:hypothetical protein